MIITQAKHGGFYVEDRFSSPGMLHELLFCGTLDECLDYIRVNLPATAAK